VNLEMNYGRSLIPCLGFLVMLPSPPDARAADLQEAEPIRQAVTDFFLGQNVDAPDPPNIRIGDLDPRLELRRCEEAIEVFSPAGARIQGNTTAGVRCRGPEPWTIYVPVTVEVYGTLLVTSRPLARGASLQPADVRPVRQVLSGLLSGYLTEVDGVQGMRLRRSVASGTVLTPAMLQVPVVVRRGDHVKLLVELPGLTLSAVGQALKDGSAGERISVRNLSSKSVVQGTVVDGGTVKVAR
jgi:flagella basal body P-ring formation protein FlgA